MSSLLLLLLLLQTYTSKSTKSPCVVSVCQKRKCHILLCCFVWFSCLALLLRLLLLSLFESQNQKHKRDGKAERGRESENVMMMIQIQFSQTFYNSCHLSTFILSIDSVFSCFILLLLVLLLLLMQYAVHATYIPAYTAHTQNANETIALSLFFFFLFSGTNASGFIDFIYEKERNDFIEGRSLIFDIKSFRTKNL